MIGKRREQFATALVASFLGGAMALVGVWWQMDEAEQGARRSAACVLGGELKVVHGALMAVVQSGLESDEAAARALHSLWVRDINPVPQTWHLAANLDPKSAMGISMFRAALTERLNMLNKGVVAGASPKEGIRDLADMTGVSGSFSQQLLAICEKGGSYEPTAEESRFTLKLPPE